MVKTTLQVDDQPPRSHEGLSAFMATFIQESQNVGRVEMEYAFGSSEQAVAIGKVFLHFLHDQFKGKGVLENVLNEFFNESGLLKNGKVEIRHKAEVNNKAN